MNHIAKLLVVALGLVLGACAHESTSTQTTQSTTTTGYSK